MSQPKRFCFHHYYLFEFQNRGFVLDYFTDNGRGKKGTERYDELLDFIGQHEMDGYNSGQILDKLPYLHSYPLRTWKEKLFHYNLSASFSQNNALYYFYCKQKITNFSGLKRYHAARFTAFSEFLTNACFAHEMEEMEFYMN